MLRARPPLGHWAQDCRSHQDHNTPCPQARSVLLLRTQNHINLSHVISFIRWLVASSKAFTHWVMGAIHPLISAGDVFPCFLLMTLPFLLRNVFLKICPPKGRARAERIPSEARFLFPVVDQERAWHLLTGSCPCLCFIPRKPAGSVRDSGRSTTASPVRSWLKKMTSSTERLCE